MKVEIANARDLLTIMMPLSRMNAKDYELHMHTSEKGMSFVAIDAESSITAVLYLLFLDSYQGEFRGYFSIPMTVTESPENEMLAPFDHNPMRLHGCGVWVSPQELRLNYFESLEYNPLPRTHTLRFGPNDPRLDNFAWVTPTTGSLRLNFTETMKEVIRPMATALECVDSAWIMTTHPTLTHPELLLHSFRFPLKAEIRFILPPQWVTRRSYN